MKIVIVARPSAHQQATALDLLAGFARHGLRASIARSAEGVRADLVCMWGHRNRDVLSMRGRPGFNYLVMERAYLGDRFQWVSLGFNGLNGRADFCTANVPADRAGRWHEQMQPWKQGGDYALVCGQVPTDAACQNVDMNRWIGQAAYAAKAYGLPVKIRRHPQDGGPRTPLVDDLARAAVCITYSSNSGVDAVMAGVPTVAVDEGAMAWDVSARHIGERITPDRSRWLERLAYCQWLPAEIRAGEAWAHLRQKLQ